MQICCFTWGPARPDETHWALPLGLGIQLLPHVKSPAWPLLLCHLLGGKVVNKLKADKWQQYRGCLANAVLACIMLGLILHQLLFFSRGNGTNVGEYRPSLLPWLQSNCLNQTWAQSGMTGRWTISGNLQKHSFPTKFMFSPRKSTRRQELCDETAFGHRLAPTIILSHNSGEFCSFHKFVKFLL